MEFFSVCTENLSIQNQWRIQDFPLGGRRPVGGATNLRHVPFSAKTYAKMKELNPVGRGGASGAPPLDPPMKINHHQW